MVTADPTVQQSLLALQQLDTRLDQLDHRRATLPERAEADELTRKVAGLGDDVVLLRTKVSDLDRDIARAEGDVATVRARVEKDQQRLAAGQGTPKDLLGLQHELVALAKRQSDLEDVELELMERREAEAELLARATEQQERASARLSEVSAAQNQALAALAAERAEVAAERESVATALPTAVLAVYSRLRDRLGEGAVRLNGARCEGCHMDLSPSDLDTVLRRPSDELVRCPECERLLVREPADAR